MKKELFDKPVICIYDIRAIQRYIFSNSMDIDIMGSGYLIRNLLNEAFKNTLKNESLGLAEDEYCLEELVNPDYIPYFKDERIKVQIISIGGGNAFMLYRTGKICEAVNHLFSKYILEHTYSLQVAITAVEMTDSIYNDVNRLYLELDKVKNSDPILHTLGALPIVKKEKMSGNAVVALDEYTKEEISQETLLKRAQSRAVTSVFSQAEFGDNLRKYNKRVAYIHMDGNSMGLTISKIMNSSERYEDGVKARQYLNNNIETNYLSTLDETEKWLFELMRIDGIPEEQFCYYYQRINVGGDDVNLVMACRYAFRFTEHFLREVSKKSLWEDQKIGRICFSVCAGIGFVPSDTSYKNGIRLAEECCEEAKCEAKKENNLINGQVGNWIDYQINEDRIVDSVSNVREKMYTSLGNANLCLRPYCLDEERKDTPSYYGKLIKYLDVFRNRIDDDRMIQEMIAAYSGEIHNLSQLLDSYQSVGGKIPKDLGKPYVRVEGRENTCAAWYDALELIRYGI